MTGDKDDEKLKGTKQNDYIIGNKGSDKIKGGKGDDLLLGGPGDDVIKGGKGADIIAGGSGINKVKGDSGADTFVLSKDDGYTKILDFNSAEDKIQITSGSKGIQFELAGGSIEIRQNGELLGVVTNQTIIEAVSDGIIF